MPEKEPALNDSTRAYTETAVEKSVEHFLAFR
jgi:hypothetical protein